MTSDTDLSATIAAKRYAANDLLVSPVQWLNVGDAELAYRVIGSGPPLLMLHGYPLNGLTFRKLIPALAPHFTCYVLDLQGAGQSRWTKQTDFKFGAQAERLKTFVDRLELTAYSTLSHDTGGTIARRLAVIDPKRTHKLVVIGTEIPNHRPAWIRMFQFRSYLPGANGNFKTSFQSRKFRRSSMGFGGVFADLDYIDGDFFELFVQPMLDSQHERQGQLYRLRGIDWTIVDSLAVDHAKITAPLLFIWGEDDPVFPLAEARNMIGQFTVPPQFHVIPNGKTFVHEEKPEAVAEAALTFLRSSD